MPNSIFNDSALDEDSRGLDQRVNQDFHSSIDPSLEPEIKLGVCKICLDMIVHKDHTLTPADVPVALTCGHIFHGGCLHTWIHKYAKIFTRQRTFNIKKIQPMDDSTCPECRAEIRSHISRLILDQEEITYKKEVLAKIRDLEQRNKILLEVHEKNSELMRKNGLQPIKISDIDLESSSSSSSTSRPKTFRNYTISDNPLLDLKEAKFCRNPDNNKNNSRPYVNDLDFQNKNHSVLSQQKALSEMSRTAKLQKLRARKTPSKLVQKNRRKTNVKDLARSKATTILPSTIRSTRRTTLDPELASIPIPILPTSTNSTNETKSSKSSYGRTLRKLQPLTANNSALPTMIDISYSSSADLVGSSSRESQSLSPRKSVRNNDLKANEVSERNTGYYKDDNFECKVTPSTQRSNVVVRSRRRINIRPNTRASRR